MMTITAILNSLVLLSAVLALPTTDADIKNKDPVSVPLYYAYGGYPRIQTNISWGTPPQKPIPVIFDTGSVSFWTYKKGAIINDGSQYLGVPGPCNKTVKQYFDTSKSSTHSPIINLKEPLGYSYGGNSKFIAAYQEVNDTISFGSLGGSPIKNVQVALSNYTTVRQLDGDCKVDVNTFDQSILGSGPFGRGGSGLGSVPPSFRENLLHQGKICDRTMSLYMSKAPKDVRGTFKGQALFGQGLPKKAYSGDLVSIKQVYPDVYIGYYSALPTFSVGGSKIGSADPSVKNCLIDSGTGTETLPFKLSDVSKHSKVIEYNTKDGNVLVAYNGSCDSIPASATFDYTFAGVSKGKSVTVKVPIRNYARGTFDGVAGVPKTICPLTAEFDSSGSCVLAAPFFTAAALQFNDDKKEILLAQGGVA